MENCPNCLHISYSYNSFSFKPSFVILQNGMIWGFYFLYVYSLQYGLFENYGPNTTLYMICVCIIIPIVLK